MPGSHKVKLTVFNDDDRAGVEFYSHEVGIVEARDLLMRTRAIVGKLGRVEIANVRGHVVKDQKGQGT